MIHEKAQGARLQCEVPGEATAKCPLEGVLHRLERWYKRERERGHEVQRKTIITQLKYELEFERDKQLVLEDSAHKSYNAEVSKRIAARLATFKIDQ